MEELEAAVMSKKEQANAVTIYRLKLSEIERVKAELVEMQEQHKENKRLLSLFQSLQTDVIDSAKDKFAEEVSKFISFDIGIYVGEKHVDIGKVNNGKVCFGLSGAEYLELKFGLAQYLYPSDSIILSEDKAIDPYKMEEIMNSLSTFSGQVILTSVTLPSTIPQDWTVVEL